MLEKISVIIPCYNVEKWIKRCLDSVFAQTVNSVHFEVICVDDKSTDNTLDILLSYERHHQENMIVIPLEENGRQGRARNIALNYTSGDYIMYVDADDLIADGMLEALYQVLTEYQCDVVGCGLKPFTDDIDLAVEGTGEVKIYDMNNISYRKACLLQHAFRVGPVARLYKKELLENEDVYFAENIAMEDIYFTELCMSYMQRYGYIDNIYYLYYTNDEGTYRNPKALTYYMDSLKVQNWATDKIIADKLHMGCEQEWEYLHFMKAFCEPMSRMLKDKEFFSYENYVWAFSELKNRFPNAAENVYIAGSSTALIMFVREIAKKLYSEQELAMLMYGESYADALAHGKTEEARQWHGKVSVLLYTINEKSELIATIKNIQQQSYSNLEIIIIDDASIDGSLELAEEKYGDCENLIYLYNEEKIGLSESFNAGIESATGEYLVFARSGDRWDADRLQCQVDILRQGAKWTYCKVRLNGKEKPVEKWLDSQLLFPSLLTEDEVSLYSILVKKECLNIVGCLDENLSELQEYDLVLRLGKQYEGVYLPDILAQIKSRPFAPESLVLSEVYLLLKYVDDLGRFGLKKDKLVQIVEKAGFLDQLECFWECVENIQEDEEYASLLAEYAQEHNLVRYIDECETDTIEGIRHCTGCGVCCEICPADAIHMKTDAKGFLTPQIDGEKCIHCGKCVACCPTQIDFDAGFRKQLCYAVQMKEEFLLAGSSGGVFPALAELVLEQGGYVAGAVFMDDFSVRHIVSNQRADIERMYGSKYVQSSMAGVYSEIRRLLEAGELVLFSGCACQVAGVRAYLGREYEKLYLIDVVCHGVPSPEAWQERVEALCAEHGKIQKITFRDKQHLGWESGLYVSFEDGNEYLANDDIFMLEFLNNWILRDSCYNCEFKAESYSDLTLGDFWGIGTMDEEYGESGTSFVTVNTEKGEELFRYLAHSGERISLFPVKGAAAWNPGIERSVQDNRMHRLLSRKKEEGLDWQQAVHATFAELHFDIAMVCMWGENYGNAMTNYALYHTLEKKYSVVAVDTGIYRPRYKFSEFAKAHCQMTSELYLNGEWDKLLESVDIFLVGSDQVWNYSYTKGGNWGHFFQLGFVGNDKRKVSYASSFGTEGLEPPEADYGIAYRNFDAISVREDFGVESCRVKYGIEAVQVLDPVFLLKADEYEDLLPKRPMEEEPYIVAYLLTPSVEKREYCESLQKKVGGLKIIYIIDNLLKNRNLWRNILKFENVKVELAMEEWLAYLHGAQYIITDSFHGTCFALIFQKPFVSFVNREPGRFEFFHKLPGVGERILETVGEEGLQVFDKPLDYGEVERYLTAERERSLAWLETALQIE